MTSSSQTSSSSTLLLVVAVVVVMAGALAIALLGGDPDDGFDLDLVDTPQVTGGPVAQSGDPAPLVVGDSLLTDGEVTLPVEGEPTLLVFLAHWCPACNAEVPDLMDWIDDGGLPEGVNLRAVATGIDPARANYPPSQWLAERDFDVPTVVDKDDVVAEAYSLSGFPFWAVVDADGRVVAATSGQIGVAGFDQLAAAAQQ